MYYPTYSEFAEELMKENSYIGKKPEEKALPTYDEAKDKLPEPVWEGHNDYIECYKKTWQIAFSNLRKAKAGTGFVSNYIDTAFNGCLFMWDSSFILMFGKYGQKIFDFQGTLDNFYSHQHQDGFICREISLETGEDRFTRFDPSATGPDIMAWCEWEYFKNFGDTERLEKVFPPLMAYHRWMKENHTWRDGTYFSSGWGCGMDNLSRQSPGYSVYFSHGHMIWVDACMQEILSCDLLINMARILKREEFIDEITEERENLLKVVNEKLWDEETGYYYDLWKNGEFNYVQHIGAYWALIGGCATKERAERMIAHLEDEEKFKTPNRVPALSKSDKNYDKRGGYWCGGVWAPTNYMVLKGLDRYERYDLSHEIAMDYLASVVEVFKKTGTVFENYAPELVDGKASKGNMAKDEFVGWTGLAPISVLFEYVFGIKPDAANSKIVWDINLTEEHGVKRYPFGVDGEMTLICKERKSPDDKPEIVLESNIPVTLEVIWGKNEKKTITIEKK